MKNTIKFLSAFLITFLVVLSFNQVKATPLTVSATSTGVYCNGGSNGTATANPSGGTTPYTYLWSDFSSQTTATALWLTAGNYTVTVTDAASNTATASVNIFQPPVFTAGIGSETNITCNGGADGSIYISTSGGTTPYTYTWPPPYGSWTWVSNNGLTAGCYTVIVTDNNGCTASTAACLTQPTTLSVTIAPLANVWCYGGNNGAAAALPVGGTTPYTYSWSQGQTTGTITGCTVGCYTVTVWDNNGCTASASTCLTEPASALNVTTAFTQASCNLSNGTATANVNGGTSPYSYRWSDPSSQTTVTATSLTAGCYTVDVWDNNGCTASASACVTQPPMVTAIISGVTNALCNGGYGSITVTAISGTSPYTYAWNTVPAQTSGTATLLTAGCYAVTVTDANGCTASASACVTQPTQLTVTIAPPINVSCNGGNNGSAVATVAGGTTPYTYAWTAYPSTTATVTGLTVGCYTLTVTDANGCTATASACVTQPSSIVATILPTNNTNCVNPNGSADVAVTGGTFPYTYSWSPTSQTGVNATGLAAGSYTCTITDNNGCTLTVSTTVGGTTAPILTLSSTLAASHGFNGTATASAVGGTPPYTYAWYPGGQTISTITGLCGGIYCCKVTDNTGCSDSNCVIVDSCINNYNEPICIITLDTITNKCELIWGRTNSPPAGGIGNYNIYKDSTAGFTLTHTQPLNVLSEYIDPNSNPSAGPVSYEISTVDSCGESALSPVHTSIYLTTTAGTNAYILNWTGYIGFTPTKYIIYRGPSLSVLVPIDSVASTVLTYTDSFPPIGSYYVLEAVSPSGICVPTPHRPSRLAVSLLSGSFSNGFNTKTLGINSLTNEVSNLTMYPNPSTGLFTLSYSMSASDDVQISIINELGQEVYIEQKHINAGPTIEQVNMETLASGIYSLRIQTNNGITVRKLVVLRSNK